MQVLGLSAVMQGILTSSPSELRARDLASCGGTSSSSARNEGGGRGPARCCRCRPPVSCWSKGERGAAARVAASSSLNEPEPMPRRCSSFSKAVSTATGVGRGQNCLVYTRCTH